MQYEILRGDCVAAMRGMPDNSVDSIVTDPPYELGFMGKTWDASGIAYSVDMWREALRVLKPGGHLLAFSGSRTYHRMTCAIEDAGFEVRDQIMWVYGSGFPKSLDVSKAIDKSRDDRDDILAVTSAMADAAERAGVSRAAVDAALGTSDMGGWWLSRLRHRCQCPKWDQWLQLKVLLQMGDELDADVWRLNGRKGTPGEAWGEREVTGQQTKARSTSGASALPTVGGETVYKTWDVTAPATDAARQWEGWGTALKPAHEPICVARKPFKGNVAANVLAHGTGALNIDRCRVPTDDKLGGGMVSMGRPKAGEGWDRPWMHDPEVTERKKGEAAAKVAAAEALGRWPANLIHSGCTEVLALFPAQAGAAAPVRGTEASAASTGNVTGERARVPGAFHGDTGSAARFFYQAKCSKSDRNSGLDGLMCVILEWNNSTTGEAKWGVEAQQVKLMVDTEQYPPKVIAAFGAGSKTATEWNTMLYGKTTTGQSLKGSTSITETKTKLTTPLAILNYFQNCITSESIPAANCETGNGGSPADSAASCSTLISTTCEKMAFLLGVSPAVSPLRLKLNASAAVSGHPTVKPVDLMAYLVRLVTPPGGLVLDPFTGSGSTGKAAIREGFRFVGCELSDEYAWLADRRIEAELVGDIL